MQSETVRRVHWFHAWSGLTVGSIIFVVTWTGTLAVFSNAISVWENPLVYRAGEISSVDVDSSVRNTLDNRYGDKCVDTTVIYLPSAVNPGLTISAVARGDGPIAVTIDPAGQSVTGQPSGPSALITRLHTDLLLPTPFGILLVGLSGVFGLMLIVSGVLLHRHIIRDLFVLRIFRSRRLALHDIHAMIETWALPFHTMLALSGAVLGFLVLVGFTIQQVVYDGDAGRMYEDFEPAVVPAGESVAMANLNDVLASVRTLERPFLPESLFIEHWGDRAARITVRGEPVDQLVWRRRATFDGQTGSLIDADLDGSNSPILSVFAAMTPIHYGNFGGLLVRWLYFLLGLALSLSIAASLVLWANKRSRDHRLLPRLAVGACAGCILATVLLFPLDLILRGFPEIRSAILHDALLWSWLAAVVVSLVQSSWARSMGQLLAASAVLLTVGAVGSTFASIRTSAQGDIVNQVIFRFDACLLLLAVSMFVLWRITRTSAFDRRVRRRS